MYHAPTRQQVYKVVDSERDYQDAKWGGTVHDRGHSVTEFLVYMRDYIEQALHTVTREPDAVADNKALHAIRKATALGVAAMEAHGAAWRGEAEGQS